jgi:hypothetical protein
MAGLDPGELQTLLTTLQQTNTQIGQVTKAISTAPALAALSNTTTAQIQSYTSDALAKAGGVPLWGLYLNSGTTPWTLAVRHV